MKYLKYLGFLFLGMLATAIYFTPQKAEYLNMIAVRLYMKTDIGRESLRNQLHAECYFTAQEIAFDLLEKDRKEKTHRYKETNVYDDSKDPIDMRYFEHEVCWKRADDSLKFLKEGNFPIAF